MTIWYVDNAAAGTNTGTSWTNAWESFGDIVWGGAGVVAGDTLYISGGSTTKTYNEVLTVGASGSAGAGYITIKTGQEANHNGVVTVTGGTFGGIIIGSKAYILLTGQVGSSKNLRITGQNNIGLSIYGTPNHVIAEYFEVDNTLGAPAGRDAGVVLEINSEQIGIELRYFVIHDCYGRQLNVLQGAGNFLPSGYDIFSVHDGEIYNYYDDPIWGDLGGVSFYNNYIHDRLNPYRGHPDLYQLHNNYYKIYNSRHRNHYGTEPAMEGEGMIQGIYWEPNGGANMGMTWTAAHLRVYNNLFEEPTVHVAGSLYVGAVVVALSDTTWDGTIEDVYVCNNTFNAPNGGGMFCAVMIVISGVPDHVMVSDVYILNNVFYNASYSTYALMMDDGAGHDITFGSYGDGDDITVDYNAFYGQGAADVYCGSAMSYAAFKAATGCQDHEVTTDPKLDANYRPQADSPLIDAGVNLSTLFTIDKDGISRPQGAGWDIGAYEYNSGAGGKFVLIFK